MTKFEEVLVMADSLSPQEKLFLAKRLTAQANFAIGTPKRHSISELRGLGKELWEGIDAQEYVNQERASWDR